MVLSFIERKLINKLAALGLCAIYFISYIKAQIIHSNLICYNSHNSSCILDSSTKLDVIIIGGGAAGCSLARTLADFNQSVLLIERGPSRSKNKYTLSAQGAGWVINDPSVSQLVVTTDNVRSHIGSVLSGGTAINYGIIIAEADDYLRYIEKFNPGVKYIHSLFKEALMWSVEKFGNPQKPSTKYEEAWGSALEEIIGESKGDQFVIQKNATWRPFTIFDSNNTRLGADSILGKPGVDWPTTLQILLEHTVDKVEMELEGSEYKATCVLVHKSNEEDIAPIQEKTSYGILESVLWYLGLNKLPPTFTNRINPKNKQIRICVKVSGKIISSAGKKKQTQVLLGAILTPLLLFKSGIGPKESVQNSKANLLINQPYLGQNLRDRAMIPLSFFVKKEHSIDQLPVSISHSVGLSYFGTDCNDMSYMVNSNDCFVAGFEELSGSRLAEGTIYSTRILFPPSIRQEPLIDLVINIITDCDEGKIPYGNVLLIPACNIAEQISACFRKVATQAYFTVEPKSVGNVKVLTNGKVKITGNYLKDPADLIDAMRGVTGLIDQINKGPYQDVFEPFFPNSCPLIILRSLLLLLNGNGIRKQIEHLVSDKTSIDKLNYQSEGQCKEDGCLESNWRPFMRPLMPSSQKYGSFPPVIPDVRNFTSLKEFVSTYLTSMWHWVGSAAMGKVVDENFKVYGTKNLHIIDASVLNTITRMNPTINIIALGRYAGLKFFS